MSLIYCVSQQHTHTTPPEREEDTDQFFDTRKGYIIFDEFGEVYV